MYQVYFILVWHSTYFWWSFCPSPAVQDCIYIFFFLWRCSQTRAMASSFLRFLDHTQRRTTVGRTPLDEGSARRRDLHLTTLNTHNRQTSMLPVGFEPTISAGERLQTYTLDRAATGTGSRQYIQLSNRYCWLLASKQTAVSVWQMPVAVCTVLNCWWWTERPSETCRVSFQNKINLIHRCI